MKKRLHNPHTEPAEYHAPAYMQISHALVGVSLGSLLHIKTEKGREDTFTVVAMNSVIESHVLGEHWSNSDAGESINTFSKSGIPEKVVSGLNKYDIESPKNMQIKLSRNGRFYDLVFYADQYYIWPANSVPGREERYRVVSLTNEGNVKVVERILANLRKVFH